MPKQCEVYLEKIQERGKIFLMWFDFVFIVNLAVENMQTSSVLQQSLNQMQRSFYSDPQSKINLQIFTSGIKSVLKGNRYDLKSWEMHWINQYFISFYIF
jgi:hypothetical protein